MDKYLISEPLNSSIKSSIKPSNFSLSQSIPSNPLPRGPLQNLPLKKRIQVPLPEESHQNLSFPLLSHRPRLSSIKYSERQISPKKRKSVLGFQEEQELDYGLLEKHQETVKQLNIEREYKQWEANCQQFIFYKLVPEALQGLKQSLQQCNNHLQQHFHKTITEYQLFTSEPNNFQKISMNDLINYQQNILQKGGIIWKCYSTDNSSEIDQIHHELNLYISHLQSFDHLFMLRNYQKNKIYQWVLQRLLKMSQNPQNYGNQQQLKMPSDSEISEQNNKIKSFVKEPYMVTRKEDILFEQIKDNYQNLYYIVTYNNEQWFPCPGKENVIGTIVLFFYGLKYRLQDYEKREFKPETNKYVDQIVNKSIY